MSLIKNKKRITAQQVADILGCAANTVYNKGAGTDKLTRIKNGKKQVRFLLDEVLALAAQQERKSLQLVIPTGPRQQHSASL
jgi:hypothetical protein